MINLDDNVKEIAVKQIREYVRLLNKNEVALVDYEFRHFGETKSNMIQVTFTIAFPIED